MDEFNREPDNNDGNYNNNNKIKDKLKKVVKTVTDKDGFYVILFICVCIVATTAAWVSKTNYDKANSIDDRYGLNLTGSYVDDIEDEEESQNVALIENNKDLVTKDTEDKGAVTPEEQKTTVTVTREIVEATTKDEEEIRTEDEETVTTMAQPILGTISMDYAVNTLVYSNTLEQWTTHNGIDIKANEGTAVKAVLDGTVSKIEKDTELGIVITLDHGNGLETKYGCLSTDSMVKVGQKVKKGDAISGVGKPSGIELADGPHLHFEVLKDGVNVDPKDYLPKFK